jgi:hypothetical protein
VDARRGEQPAQVGEDPFLRVLELAHLGVDRGELLRRRLAVERDHADSAAHLPGEPATRIIMNSSRLLPEIDRKRSRSSSG